MHSRKDRVFIISELSNQYEGDIALLETMILQSKLGGADAVKIQIFDSLEFGNSEREFLQIDKEELSRLFDYASRLSIPLFASVFDDRRLTWLQDIKPTYMKIASKTHRDNLELCEKIARGGKRTFVSNGMDSNNFPLAKYENVEYLYCYSNYPATIEEIGLPDFRTHQFYRGYSDHTVGITAAQVAVTRGAKIIEKHFTTSKSLQSSVNKGHLGSMNLEELSRLRAFCDEYTLMNLDD